MFFRIIRCAMVCLTAEHGVKSIFHDKNIGIETLINLSKTPNIQNQFVKYTLHFYNSMQFIYVKNVKSHIFLRTTEFTQSLFYRLIHKVLCDNQIQIRKL